MMSSQPFQDPGRSAGGEGESPVLTGGETMPRLTLCLAMDTGACQGQSSGLLTRGTTLPWALVLDSGAGCHSMSLPSLPDQQPTRGCASPQASWAGGDQG